MTVTTKYLPIYLNDHLAGATAGAELARRASSENEGSELGDALAGLAAEIEADRQSLEEIMDMLGASRDRTKVAAAWLGEKAGRLKLNGELLGRSPLSTVVELEALTLGVTGKRLLWQALSETVAAQLPAGMLDELIDRAERQLGELQDLRLGAAKAALQE